MNHLPSIVPDADVRASLRGVDVDVEVSIDKLEWQRRAAAGIAGQQIGGPRALGVLLKLPELIPVDASALPDDDLEIVGRLEGAVDFPSPGVLQRVARPAVCPLLVSIHTNRWRDGLRLAGRFAPYSARRLVLHGASDDLQPLLLEADYWGVGVALCADGAVRELLPPATFTPVRYTAAAWKFDEDLYAQL